MKTTLEPLPFSLKQDPGLSWSERLTTSVIIALIQGELKPGDPFPTPSALMKVCLGHHQEVLDSITLLLSHRILQQDRSGHLRIHPAASPTVEMKKQAFLMCARQLVRQARKWALPRESILLLLREAAQAQSKKIGVRKQEDWCLSTL
jgi:hypothetical protein